ncbi:MAG: PAS domain S-box protein [Planctomycetota bacterium]
MERLRTHLLVLLTLTVAVHVPALGQEQDTPVRIGVLAERGTEKCLENWGPTAEYLTEQIPGRSFVIVPLAYGQVCPAVERGEVDFVFTNPSLYVEAEVCHGVNRLATLEKPRLAGVFSVYGGVILCRADREDIQDLGDLKGKTFMAVKETSFGGWRAVWLELNTKGIDPHRDFTELLFGGTHDAVVYAVRDGKVDAGCVRTDTLEYMTMEGKICRERFRVLNEHSWDEYPFVNSTPMYPEWPLAKLAHTPNELAEKVTVALIGMPADSPAAKAGRYAGWAIPPSYEPVRDCLRALHLPPYRDFGKITFGDVLKRYWSWIAAIVVLVAGMVVMLAWALRLLRQRTRAEQSLRLERDTLQVLMDGLARTGVGVDVVGSDYTVQSQNAVLMERFGNLTGKRCYEGYMGFGEPCDFCPMVKALADRRTASAELTAVDGRSYQLLAAPLPNPDGTVDKAVEVVLDITERKQAEAALAARTAELEQQTVALEKSRRAAMGMMEDAEQARKVVEAAREALHNNKERLRAILDTIQAGVVVIEEEDHTIVDVNPAALVMIGAPREEVVGRACHEYFCPGGAGCCPISDQGQEVDDSERVLVKADGQTVPILKTVTRAMLDGRGHLLESFVDISDLKQAEERLRESEERHRVVTETAQDAVITADAEGNIRLWNPAAEEIFGFTAADAIGRNLMDVIVPPKYHEAKRKGLAAFAHTGRGAAIGKTLELTALRKDGTEIPVEISVSSYRDGDDFVGVALVRDITERKRAEGELEELHQRLVAASRRAGMSEVATDVLHNVGNVLNSINVSASLVGEKIRGSRVPGLAKATALMTEHADDLGTFITQDERGKQLPGYLAKLAERLADEQTDLMGELWHLAENIEHIKNIVGVQQSLSGASGVTEPVRINTLLDDLLKMDAASLDRHGIDVAREYDELPVVTIDKHKLTQILVNLLKNAKEALAEDRGPDQRLTVRIKRVPWAVCLPVGAVPTDPTALADKPPVAPDHVRIEVADNAVGIPPENLTKIFAHGFTTKKDGHGFGLHGSALAARELGGSLTAHSDGPGQGATFILELPLEVKEKSDVCPVQ